MGQQRIKIKDFAAERGVSYNTITQYLYRVKHSTTQKSVKYEGLVQDGDGSKEKYILIGSPIWTALDEKYPKPTKPAEIVINEEMRQERDDALKDAAVAWRKVAELQEKLINMQREIAEGQAIKLLADQATADRDRAIEERDAATKQAQEAVEARYNAEKVLNEEKDRADAAERKIEEMRGSGLWKRIRNKW